MKIQCHHGKYLQRIKTTSFICHMRKNVLALKLFIRIFHNDDSLNRRQLWQYRQVQFINIRVRVWYLPGILTPFTSIICTFPPIPYCHISPTLGCDRFAIICVAQLRIWGKTHQTLPSEETSSNLRLQQAATFESSEKSSMFYSEIN